MYVSDQRHVSVDKAVDAIGLGRDALRALPTDAEFRLRIDALEEAIAKDKHDGVRPMCVVGIFGTTNTGAVDDLHALRRIADREGMWLHADAAYGGGMLLSHEFALKDARAGAGGFSDDRSAQVVLCAAGCGRGAGEG